jgi:hypothetical protein
MFITETSSFTAELTFADGKTYKQQYNGVTESMLEATLDDLRNNDQVKNFIVKDSSGKVIATR